VRSPRKKEARDSPIVATTAARSLESSARYSNGKIAVNPSFGFFLSLSIMELVSRG
jgi:hypothetical protein